VRILLMERISCRAHLDQARISDDSLQLHGVDERLAQSDILDARIIKAIDIVPDWNALDNESAIQ
jgi:hypothetical protein